MGGDEEFETEEGMETGRKRKSETGLEKGREKKRE